MVGVIGGDLFKGAACTYNWDNQTWQEFDDDDDDDGSMMIGGVSMLGLSLISLLMM